MFDGYEPTTLTTSVKYGLVELVYPGVDAVKNVLISTAPVISVSNSIRKVLAFISPLAEISPCVFNATPQL
jgi:hypothetical protein